MKAKDWKFNKIIPDNEDFKAGQIASDQFFKHPPAGMKITGDMIDVFHSAFNRGLAWAKAKYEVE